MAEVIDTIPLLPELLTLSNFLEEKPECFAYGSKDLQAAALEATKFTFDLSLQSEAQSRPRIVELLSSLSPSEAPQTRSQARANGKRKRSPSPPPPEVMFEATPLTSLFLDGMDEDQIWAQLDLRAKTVCEMLEHALEGEASFDGEKDGQDGEEIEERLRNALQALENGGEVDLDGLDLGEMDFDDDDSDSMESEEEEESEIEPEDDADLGEAVTGLRDPSTDEESKDSEEDFDAHSSLLDFAWNNYSPSTKRSKAGAHASLDDGFFDLNSFNAETEEAEARTVSKGGLSKVDDDDDSDDGISVDLFAPVDGIENFDEEDLEHDPGDAFYRDFFEQPPRVAPSKSNIKPAASTLPKSRGTVRFHDEVRVKKIQAKGKNLPLYGIDLEDEFGEDGPLDLGEEGDGGNEESGEGLGQEKDEYTSDEDLSEGERSEDEETGRETIERLKDDLFADDENSQQQDMSTHEKRMAALREQIMTLEAENVGQKEWVLMGEAGSRTRPQNSLLEEDLEFERVMKAVPVVTEESVQNLEERIKARILDGHFDDVVRIGPMEDKPFLPSRFFELKDTKSTQSLAQIYESEYVATQTGGVPGEDRDGKLKKEHDEIENLWENISGKLDALCNAHFMPKQPKATISTISNISTVTLESALPTAKSASTMLAPEEVFAPQSSGFRARSELTPAEKRALHNKERKSKKTMRDSLDKSVDKYAKMKGIGGVKKRKQAALESVVKSGKGVTVVGKTKKDISAKKDRRSRT